MKTIIIGASPNPERYAHQAAVLLKKYGHEFIPLGIKRGEVLGQPIHDIRSSPRFDDVHTITLYIRPELQPNYYDYLISLKPKQIIFNPGTENTEFEKLAQANGIEIEEACTLVLLRTGQF